MDKGYRGEKQSNTLHRIVALILVFVSATSPVLARSSSEIGQDIIDKQNEIAANQERLKQSEANKAYYESESANLADGVPKLEAQLKKLEEELNGIKLEISILEQQQKLKELERERTQFAQNETIKGSYMDWKSTSHDVRMFIDEEIDFLKIQQYQSTIAGNQGKSIDNLTNELIKIDGEMTVLAQKKQELDAKQLEISEQKRQLEERLNQLKWGALAEAGNITALGSSIKQAVADIAVLSAEQRAALIREQEIQQNNPGLQNSAGCDGASVPTGSFYFCGNGRDLYQGHGVGMSQYGAKGAAQKGESAESILNFYYYGATVSTIAEPAEISITYCQGSSWLAETYNNCNYNGSNYGPVITERIALVDYLGGLGEMPYSWPEEARKAQMIAARTYALRRTNNGDPNYPICLTASCQVSKVKSGENYERPLAVATAGKVILHNGGYIDALYSADNSQNAGTADCGTRFQDVYGNPNFGCGPYLVSVNDNHWAWDSRMYGCSANGVATPCGLWPWKTRTYTYAQFDEFLTWVRGNLYWEFASVGNTTYISFERDASGRIKRANILGTGGSLSVGGWWFKNAWIEWTAARGEYDYLYSQTLNVVQL